MSPRTHRRWRRFALEVVLLALGLCLGTLSAPALAQPPTKARIGYLASSSYVHPAFGDLLFREVMSVTGGMWGGNLVLLSRSAAGSDDRLPSLARELVEARVDIIVAEGQAAALAAKAVTRTVPIVMAISGDPVQAGLVANLARPGGNVTGVTSLALELAAKRLQLIKDVVPKASRVAVLWNPASPEKELEWKELRAAASKLGVTLQSLELRRPGDLEPRLDSAVSDHAGALLLLDDSLTLSLAADITTAAERRRLPAIYGWDRYMTVEPKGLMAYGPTVLELAKTAARYMDRILNGAKPGDLPVEQPTKFELVINAKAARALGLTIPPSLVLRADRVIR
ncbi:MAG TPA: ABC transporter substrate-binding protein [Methylomirabilota bacterium]|nr:ABC transporter substrate-binding protein [Methylomirabilota bacterium]